MKLSYAQICDSLVPTFNVDLTGANAGTTWTSPTVVRNGYCCDATNIDRCIQFVVTTGSNTCGLSLAFYISGPPGTLFLRVCCGNQIEVGDTAFVSPGTNYITFCKPGNATAQYTVTSLTNCISNIVTTPCSLILPVSEESGRADISLFPNPFHTAATLISNWEKAQLNIYDALGTLVGKMLVHKGPTTIDRNLLADGIYFYKLQTEDGKVVTGKLVLD